MSENSYTVPAHAQIECKNCIIGEATYLDLQIAKKEDIILIPDSCVFIHNGKRAVYKITDAKTELKAMVADSKFGEASSTVVIEEFLKGIELSVFVLTDGNSYKILPSAKDNKRIGDAYA